MAQKFWEVFWDSFRSLFRGRVPLAALLIGTPLVFTVLFGVIYDGNVVNDIALTVYDEDQSSMSRTLIQAYGDSDRFHIVSYVSSEEEMKADILGGRARAALEIPRDFSKDVRLGQGADDLLMVNSANNMFGNAALAASQEIARSLSVGVGQKLMEGVGLKPDDAMNAAYPVHLGVRITGDPANGYTSFMHGARALPHRQLAALLGQHRKARSARHRVLPRWWRAVPPPAAAEPPGSRWMKLVPEPSPRSRFPLASRRFLLFEKCK